MITDKELDKNIEHYYFNNPEPKTQENGIINMPAPPISEIRLNEENPLNNTDTSKIILHNIFLDKFSPFDLDFEEEENTEDLYFIKKFLVSDKKNEISISTDEKSQNHKEIHFPEKKKTKRKKEHDKFEKDNVMRKINIHFISFIVKFVNYNIKKLLSNKHPLFANLSYDFKKNINNNTFKELKSKTIGEVLKNEGSNKNKRNMNYQKDENEKLFNSLHESVLKDLLDINYIQFFRQVYMQAPGKNELEVLKRYNIPKNILFFDDFIKSEVEKDKINGELYRERLEYLSKSEFVNEGYPFFETKIMKKRHKK